MARHAEDTLRGASIAEVLNLTLAVPAPKAVRTESLVTCQDSQIFNFVAAMVAAICAVVAYQGAVAEQEEVRIGIEQGAASIAAEAVNVPSVASY
jgi:hypothetical protein